MYKPNFWLGISIWILLRQALFVVSILTAKSVFVVSVLTAIHVLAVSMRLWVFQKNLKFTNFLSIWKMKLYSVTCMKYFSLEFLGTIVTL